MSNFYTVNNLRKDIDSDLHAGGVSNLQDFYNTVDKGRRAMIGKVRPEELIRKSYLEEALYPEVFKYAVPDDLKYSDVIELQQLSSYRNVDTMNQPTTLVYRRRFGQKRESSRNIMNIGYENGVKYANVFRPTNRINGGDDTSADRYQWIHRCNSIVDNGTWNVGGNVVNLKLDELTHLIGSGSIGFGINNSSSTGFIENFTLEEFSLETFLNKGASFAWLNIPLPKEMISVKLTLGSNTTNLTTDLYQSTVSSPHNNNVFDTGWNLLKWMLNSLTTVGVPDPTALKYVRFDFVTTGQEIPACNIDNIITRIGTVYEITYNSSYCFMDALTGAWKKTPTSDTDIIIAEEDTYNILRFESSLSAQKEIYGSAGAAKSDISDITTGLREAYDFFNKEHKSEALIEEDSLYVFGNYLEGNYTDHPQSNERENYS